MVKIGEIWRSGTMANNILDKYVDMTRPLNFVPRYCRWAMVALASAILSRKCWIHSEAFGYLYPTMYIIFVGRPGLGKTIVINRACEWFLDELTEEPNYASDCSTPAAFIEEFAKSYKQKNLNYSPLFVRAGELTAWFQDIGGGSFTQFLINFYDPMRPGQMWSKKLIRDGGSISFPNPALTLFGATTPDQIRTTKLMDTAGQGLLSRCVFVCEPEWHDHVPGAPKLDSKLRYEIFDVFRRMSEEIKGEFKFSADAEPELIKDNDYKNEKMSASESETLHSHFIVRRSVHIQKVALILSAMRDNKKIITGQDIRDARALIDDVMDDMMYAFGRRINKNDPALWDKILKKLPEGKFISHAELVALFEQDGEALPYSEDFRSVIEGLVMSGTIITKNQDGMVYYGKP